jgi:hypothetical protein
MSYIPNLFIDIQTLDNASDDCKLELAEINECGLDFCLVAEMWSDIHKMYYRELYSHLEVENSYVLFVDSSSKTYDMKDILWKYGIPFKEEE